MKIIILGAGQVGTTVADNLASEANDITIVDLDTERLRSLQDHLDIRTVAGHASHPDVLRKAGETVSRIGTIEAEGAAPVQFDGSLDLGA